MLHLQVVTLGGSGRAGGWLTRAGFGKGGMAGGVEVECILRDAHSDGGKPFGISKPLSLRLINLHAIENSLMSIFPSASVSARPL